MALPVDGGYGGPGNGGPGNDGPGSDGPRDWDDEPDLPGGPPPYRGRGDVDPPLPADGVLRRYGARALDPAAVPVAPGGQPPRSTAYLPGRLLVPADVWLDFGLRARIEALAGEQRIALRAGRRSLALAERFAALNDGALVALLG